MGSPSAEHPIKHTYTPEEEQKLDATLEAIANSGKTVFDATKPNSKMFVIFADGTENNRNDKKLQETIISRLQISADKGLKEMGAGEARYYAGPGTGENNASGAMGSYLGSDVDDIAEFIYNDYKNFVIANPGVDVSIAGMAFSRGGGVLSFATHYIVERGVPDPTANKIYTPGPNGELIVSYDKYLVWPGEANITKLVMGDRVVTGVNRDPHYLSMVSSPNLDILAVQATDEHRGLFTYDGFNDPLTNQPYSGVTEYKVLGAHADLFGGYISKELSLRMAGALRENFIGSGIPMAELRPEDLPSGEPPVVHNSSAGLAGKSDPNWGPGQGGYVSEDRSAAQKNYANDPRIVKETKDRYDDGSRIWTRTYDTGMKESITTDEDGRAYAIVRTQRVGNLEETVSWTRKGDRMEVTSKKTVQFFDDPDGQSRIENWTYTDGRTASLTFDSAGRQLDEHYNAREPLTQKEMAQDLQLIDRAPLLAGTSVTIDGRTYVQTVSGEYVIDLANGQREIYDSESNELFLEQADGRRETIDSGEGVEYGDDNVAYVVKPNDGGGGGEEGGGQGTGSDDPTGSKSFEEASEEAKHLADVIGDVTSLVNAIKAGKSLPLTASGIKLLNTLTDGKIETLNSANQMAQGAMTIYNLYNAFSGGASDLTKVNATLSAVSLVNQAFIGNAAVTSALNGTNQFGLLGNGASAGTVGGVGVLPAVGLVLAIKAKDPVGIAMSAGVLLQGAAFMTTPIGWVLLIASLAKAMKEPPEAWGVGTFKFGSGTSLVLETQGESFGKDRVDMLMKGNGKPKGDPDYFGGLEGYLRDQVMGPMQAANPDELLGIIPQRLPVLSWREARQSEPGYGITDIDPVTGKERYPGLRYNDDWTPYNADASDPEQRRNIFERMVVTALAREAVAPMWEVQTARMQQDAGDPNAGLTEEVRAARRGFNAGADPLTNKLLPGVFRPVALDMNGDGVISVVSNADNDRAFNWDGSGFDKQVGWVGEGEGLLYLDRNPNGLVDGGKELFSNSNVADVAKGLRSLSWVDANVDGLINALDPVFNELKIWNDANGDAVAQADELKTMGQLGITELDYNNGRFTRNGSVFAMRSQDLETSSAGQKVSVTPDGIRVEFDNGQVQVHATRVTDASIFPRVLNVSSASALEGQAIQFVVALSGAASNPVELALALESGSAQVGTDLSGTIQYSLDNGQSFSTLSAPTLMVPVGAANILVRVQTADNDAVTAAKDFLLKAATGKNANWVTGRGVIADDDGPPQMVLSGPASADEGAGTLTYTVRLSHAAKSAVTVHYATANGTAAAGSDFAGVESDLRFEVGEIEKTFTVSLQEDNLVEGAEGFEVRLSNAQGAEIAFGTVQTVIADNDFVPADPYAVGDDDLGNFNEDGSVTATRTPATIVVSYALMLANDTYNNGAPGDGLTIVGVQDARNIHVELDAANQQLLIKPNADYVGEASFQYLVRGADGDTRVARVFMNFTEVNDIPVVTVERTPMPVYGYGPAGHQTYDNDGGFGPMVGVSGRGIVMNRAYQTVGGRAVLVDPEGTYLGLGPLYDTGVTMEYFNERYREAVNRYGGMESWDGMIRFVLDGGTVAVDGSPPAYDHSAVITTEEGNDGRVVATDPDGSTQFKFEVISGPLYGQLGGAGSADDIDPVTGAFTYTGRRYVGQAADGRYISQNVLTDDHGVDEAQDVWYDTFVVRVTDLSDPTLKTFRDEEIKVRHYGPAPDPNVQSGGKKPIAIDLNNDGFHFTDVDDSNVFFDVNGDGWRRKIAWNNPNDGFIAFDKNGDGKITDFDEISFVPYKPDGQTDLEGLRAFDTNKDGVFSAGDEKWASFGVWQDANSNGVTDPGEFRSLDAMGISTIGLTSDGRFQVIDGQSVHGTAVATLANGGTMAIADVTLRYKNIGKLGEPGQDGPVQAVPTVTAGQTFEGTAGADLVLGTNGSDLFNTGDGDDVVTDDAGNDGVTAGAGKDLVYTGEGNDYVDAGDGDDVVFAGVGSDVVMGGDGDDMLMLEAGNDIGFGGDGQDMMSGGVGNDALSGDAGDDQLLGEDGWDALFGQEGNDELWGGDGNDALYGGDGDDMLAGGAGDDAMEGGAGNDRYDVDSVGDTVLELAGEGIDTVRSLLSYQLGDNVEHLTLLGQAAIDGTGNAADNQLTGNEAANTLRGLDGNDVLDGGAGADLLDGGAGDDTYVVDNAGDQVVESANRGNDTVRASVNVTLSDNVENAVLTGRTALSATGNDLDNRLTGNAAANRLDGGLGADVLEGGRGDDIYVVDQWGDQVVERSGEGIDTVEAGVDYTLGDAVENLVLTGYARSGEGNALSNTLRANDNGNTLSGGGATDLLIGGKGRDTLDGGTGADILRGGQGNDTYIVDNAADVVDEMANGDPVLLKTIHGVKNQIGWVEGGAALIDAMADYIAARPGQTIDVPMLAEHFKDMEGAWVIDWNHDWFTPLLTLDYASGSRIDGGKDTVVASIDYTLGSSVEHLTLADGALVGTGNALNNKLVGNAGNNVLDGRSGADFMVGGEGDDLYFVDNVGDRVLEADDFDQPWSYGLRNMTQIFKSAVSEDWWPGLIDTRMAEVQASLQEAFDNGATSIWETNVPSILMEFYSAQYNSLLDEPLPYFTDFLSMSWSDPRLMGGHDTVHASASYVADAGVEDVLLTGAAIAATGNLLDNLLTGNELDNVLDGGAGNDTLIGGRGNDVLMGGDGDDFFAWKDVDGLDAISDLSGFDVLSLGDGLTADGFDYVTEDVDGQQRTTLIRLDADGNATAEGVVLNGSAATGFEIEEIRFADGMTQSVQGLLDAIDTRKQPAGTDYYGTDGDDTFYLRDGTPGQVNRYHGGLGYDRILGDWGSDILRVSPDMRSLDGIELIDGLDDFAYGTFIVGSEGRDTWDFSGMTVRGFIIAPGDGDDVVIGTDGHDMIQGGKGADTLYGGAGDDTFYLTPGDYTIDHFDGGTGTNRLYADWGAGILLVGTTLENLVNIQTIEGVDLNFGAQRIVSTSGDDTLDFTGITVKNFMIDTGDGNDVVIGGDGDNLIRGGRGTDTLTGGAGNDVFVLTEGDYDVDVFEGGTGINAIRGSYGNDILRVDNHLANLRHIQAIGGDNNNLMASRILAGDGDDTLDFGGMSIRNFAIDAGGGNDVIIGSADSNVFHGGTGDDLMTDAGGDDLYLWQKGDGNDHISDSAGDNTLDLGSYLDPAGVTVATTETGWQLQVRHDGQMSLLTIDRYQASTMKVRIDANTWSIDSLPASDYVTPWDASGGAAMARGSGWASMDGGDSQRLDADHATNGLIGGGATPRRSTTL